MSVTYGDGVQSTKDDRHLHCTFIQTGASLTAHG